MAGVLLFLLAIASVAGREQEAEQELSSEDRRVLEIVLAGRKGPLLDTTLPICPERSQQPCFSADFGQELLPPGWQAIPDSTELRVAFRARNATSYRLGRLDAPLPLISGEKARALLPSRSRLDARPFEEAFPGVAGFIQVSAPGFSGDGRRALVYVESVCPGRSLCGSGSLQLVERQGAEWRARSLLHWQAREVDRFDFQRIGPATVAHTSSTTFSITP